MSHIFAPRRLLTATSIAVIVSVGLAGCAATGSTAANGTKGGQVKIGFAIPTSKATYFTAYVDAVRQKAKELGVQVSFAFAEDDANKMNTQISDFATAGVKGIVVAPVDVDANVVGVDQLGSSGPALITSNRFLKTTYGGANGKNPQVHTGFSDYTIGKNEGDLIVNACGSTSPCNVVLEVGSLGSAPQIERQRGTEDVLKTHSNVKILATETNDFQAPKAIDLTSQLLTKYPTINVLATQDDATAVGAVQAIKQVNRQAGIKVVGVGGSKDGIAAVQSGAMYGTVWVSPRQDGLIALDTILKLINKQSVKTIEDGGRPTVAVPIHNVTKDNAGQYPGEW